MLKEQDIQQFLEKKNIPYQEKSSIIGVIFPQKLTYALGPAASALSMQYYAIHFNDSGIAVIGLNNATGKLEDEACIYLPKQEIKQVQFHKKMASYQLEIETTNGVLSFKVNKGMVGASWHKENLQSVLQRF